MTKDQKMLHHSLLAQWHMHSASNGHCETRVVWRGDEKLTPDELRDSAMETAMRHIKIVENIAEVPDEEYMG